MVQVVGQSWSVWETKQYAVTLIDKSGVKHLISVYGIDCITSPIQNVILDGIMHKFPETRPLDIKRPEGPVDILVGIDRLSLHPTPERTAGEIVSV